MKTVTLSAKYQVVIPKELRRDMHLMPGQDMHVSRGRNGDIVLSTTSVAKELRGKYKGVWGKDSTRYLADLRVEANRDRA